MWKRTSKCLGTINEPHNTHGSRPAFFRAILQFLTRFQCPIFSVLTMALGLSFTAPETALAKSDKPASSASTGATAQSAKPLAQLQEKSNSGAFNLIGHGGPVRTIRLANTDRRALTGSFDYTMILWDLSSSPAKILRRFRDHGGPVNSTHFLQSKKQALSGVMMAS